MMKMYDKLDTPVGAIYPVFEAESLTAIEFVRPRMKAGKLPPGIRRELEAYFKGELREFSIRIKVEGETGFEGRVRRALMDIPYGETRSYKQLAIAVGNPRSARAVGQALGRNPVPIVVPCHRVIESGGALGGYAPGAGIKRRLLDMEYYYSQGAR